MKVEINYPKLKKEVNKFLIFRKIMLIKIGRAHV